MSSWRVVAITLFILAGCTGGQAATAEVEVVKQRYGGYTLEQAGAEGYEPDPFCLDAASFGQPARLGAMGFHVTNETLLRAHRGRSPAGAHVRRRRAGARG